MLDSSENNLQCIKLKFMSTISSLKIKQKISCSEIEITKSFFAVHNNQEITKLETSSLMGITTTFYKAR